VLAIYRTNAEEGKVASTKEVLDRHLKFFGVRDLDGIMADYAPEVVLLSPRGAFSPDGILKGKAAARQVFQTVFAEFGKPGMSFDLKQVSIEGDYAYIVWGAETADNIYELASDTFVLKDGKIVAQSFAAKITAKH
jgi:ketosteroid isomerase-like protein